MTSVQTRSGRKRHSSQLDDSDAAEGVDINEEAVSSEQEEGEANNVEQVKKCDLAWQKTSRGSVSFFLPHFFTY